jgi:UDP-N-acetylmuramoyl-tripeptide--D-alanyl-D-alanine ligase
LASALRTHLRRPGGRMQVRRLANGGILLDDTYNANPQSFRAALQTLAEIGRGRPAVIIAGEMRELGAVASSEHESLGLVLAGVGARLGVSCGGLADLALRNAQEAGLRVVFGKDAEDAARLATTLVKADDVVLVKASRGVGAERVVDALVRAGGGEVGVESESR